jgi:hypothetical protein
VTKKNSLRLLTLAGSSTALALGVAGSLTFEAACSSSGGGGTTSPTTSSSGGSATTSSGTTSSSGGGEGGTGGTMTVPLTISSTGFVSMASVGIDGSFFVYGDSIGTNGMPGGGDCQNAGFSNGECSSVSWPPLGGVSDAEAPDGAAVPLGFPTGGPNGTDGASAMCLSGVLAKVIAKADGGTTLDYSDIWGLGIGLDFNNPNGTAGTWNSVMNSVVGFSFTVSGYPTGGKALSVEFPTPATVAAGNDTYAIQITKDGNYTAMLTKAATPAYGGDGPELSLAFNPTSFTAAAWDPTMITAIQFHLLPATAGTTPVTDFCVSNLSAIVSN